MNIYTAQNLYETLQKAENKLQELMLDCNNLGKYNKESTFSRNTAKEIYDKLINIETEILSIRKNLRCTE